MTNTSIVRKKERQESLALPNKMPRQFETTVAPPTSVGGLILILFVMGLGLFGGLGWWANVASIQGAVVANGTFEVEGDLQVIDHLEGGTVQEIYVRDGQTIEAGDPILQLDGTRIDAQIGILLNQLTNALAQDARLRAEAAGFDQITFGEDVVVFVDGDPTLQAMLDTQSALFDSNRENNAGEHAIFEERIKQLNQQLIGLDDAKLALETQLGLVREDLVSLKDLRSRGLALAARVIARQEDEVLIMGRLSQAESDRQSVLQQIAEVQQRGLQINRDRASTIARDQQAVTELIYDVQQRLSATQRMLDQLTIRAPMAGLIVGFTENTLGSSISPGEEIMRIVPRGKDFIVEVQVATSDIDEIVMGGPVRVRLSAYSFRKTPPIAGVVTHVSGDAFFNETTGSNYYQVQVTIPKAEFAVLPDVEALPGMPVQVMIATQEQTVLSYLLDPILGGLETAMVEGE